MCLVAGETRASSRDPAHAASAGSPSAGAEGTASLAAVTSAGVGG